MTVAGISGRRTGDDGIRTLSADGGAKKIGRITRRAKVSDGIPSSLAPLHPARLIEFSREVES